jgi:putative membrane protein
MMYFGYLSVLKFLPRMYLYVKALHVVFIVTWFSGLFYVVRLFIYNAEANEKSEPGRTIILDQLMLMTRRLWYGITWPSAILTLIFGTWMYIMYAALPAWLVLKLCFVAGLYLYHLSLHMIFRQQVSGIYKYSSRQLRIWNEVATVFLIAIVMLVVVKDSMSFVWALAGLVLFIIILLSAIRIYRYFRMRNS